MKALLIGISLTLLILPACKTTQMAPTEPEKQQETSDNMQHPSDRESVYVKGIEIPVFREKNFDDALNAAKLEFGDLYNGYFMWQSDIYNLDGQRIKLG